MTLYGVNTQQRTEVNKVIGISTEGMIYVNCYVCTFSFMILMLQLLIIKSQPSLI